MPPEDASSLGEVERGVAIEDLAGRIQRFQEKNYAKHGRAVSRRVNRFEYENILRDLLHDPTLKVADQLPLDGEVHGFAKVGTALDVSHVQVNAYLDAAESALRRAIEFPVEKPQPQSNRYYAREEPRMWAGTGNTGWARFSLALEGLEINDTYSFEKKGFDPAYEVRAEVITVDNTSAELTGTWRESTKRSNHVGTHYLADNNEGTGTYTISWKAELPKPGTYEVRVSFIGGKDMARKAPYLIRHAEGETQLTIDQTVIPTIENLWFPIGRFRFGSIGKGSNSEPVVAEISLSNKDANGWVVADAVQFVPLDDSGEENQKLNCQKSRRRPLFFAERTRPFITVLKSSKHQSVVTTRFA